MNNMLKTTTIIFLCFIISACAGIKRQGYKSIKEVHRIAIVEVSADSAVSSERPVNSGGSKLGALKAMSSMIKAKSIMKGSEAEVHFAQKAFNASLPVLLETCKAVDAVEIVCGPAVTNNPVYQNMPPKVLSESQEVIVAPGYKKVDLKRGSNAASLCNALNVDGLVAVHTKYKWALHVGVGKNGTATGWVSMEVRIYDRNGKQIWNKSVDRVDPKSESTPIVDGVYSREKLDPSLVNAFDTASKGIFLTIMSHDFSESRKY